MKTLFKSILLLLITSASCYAQRHVVLNKSFDVDKNTSVILNFDNIYVAIEESTDGKIHFDYVLEFQGYSKKAIQKFLNEVKVEATSFDNNITLEARSENKISFETFALKSPYGISIKDDYFKSKSDTIVRKSKDSLLNEIRKNNYVRRNNPLRYINERFKKIDKNGKLSNIKLGGVDIMRSQFVIKIPPFLKLSINAKNSGVHFRNDMQNELLIDLKSGTLKTKSLINTYNKIKIDDANFEAQSIIGGDYSFKNVKKSKIGHIQNVKITSEFSKVEIGEIDKKATITDFNSEYWFYNWSTDFNRFSLYSEYSKIHMFYPKTNHSMKVIGNNTKSLIGNNEFEINMQPTSKGEKYTMITKEPHPGKTISGQIFFDIVHGIIYTHEDSIKIINN